jgi:Uma2 family endonuclease
MEATSAIKHEYVAGAIFAMAGAKPGHNLVASNALIALGLLQRGRACRAFNSDQRIYVAETGLYTYADGGLACGRWQIHADGMRPLNSTLIVEVLSASTRDDDRGAKLEHCTKVPSLRHVLLIDQPDRCVEHHRRTNDGAWSLTVVREGAIALPDLGGAISLDELYLDEVL